MQMKKVTIQAVLALLLCGVSAWASPSKDIIRLSKEDGTRSIPARSHAMRKAPSFNAPKGDNLLFGSLLDTDATWSDYGLGVYSFPYDGSHISDINKVQSVDGLTTFAGVYADNRYYAITRLLSFETFYLDVYNTDTWELETYYSLGLSSVRYVPNDLAYDPITELAYGVVYDYDSQRRFCLLYKYDLRKGTLQYVGTTRVDGNGQVVSILAMSSDVNGQLYGISNEGILYKVDKESGALERVGATGVPKISSLQGSTITAQNQMLWAAYDTISYNSALYSVNLQTALATKLSDFPHNENMTGLFVTTPFAKNEAPAAVEGLKLTGEPGSLAGNIRFTAPKLTTGGAALGNEPLTANIRIYKEVENDGVIEVIDENVEKTVSAGEITDYSWQMEQTNYIVSVTVSNAVGKSENRMLKFWAGHDYPAEIEKITLERDTEGNGVLTWTPPASGYNGGYFDASTLEYDIERLPDNVMVATGYKSTEGKYVDTTIDKVNMYRYRVTPRSSGGAGPSTLTNECGLGAFSTVPYAETFDTKAAFELWTVVDLNQHENTSGNWSSTWGFGSQNMVYNYEPKNNADDWVISPPIELKAGAVYKVAFKAWSDMANYPESLKVMVGTSTNPDDMLIQICDYPSIKETSDLSDDKGGSFSVAEDGLYHIGFYCYSKANYARLYVDNVRVDLVSGISAPGAVTGLKAEAGANGACSATLSFRAPNTTGSNMPLGSLDRVEIYRNGSATPAGTIRPAEMDKEYRWVDNSPTDMEMNTYKVVPVNEAGNGYPAEISVYVGIDVPSEVTDLYLSHGDNGEAIITWTAPTTGANGGYINPDDIVYGIVDNTGNPVASRLKQTTFTDTETPSNVQKMRFYTVKASSEAGTSQGTNTNAVIFGPSYRLPFAESFAGGYSTQTSPWTIIGATSVGFDWHVLMQSQTNTPEAYPQDGDSGFAQFTSYSIPKGDSAILTSPLISLEGEINPEFSFWFYHYKAENAYGDAIQPVITTDEGLTFDELSEPIKANISDNGWTQYSFSLDDYVGQSRVRVGLKGISDYGYNIFVDNILVQASQLPPVTDLSATVNGRKVLLSWSDPVYESLELTGFNVYRDGAIINLEPVTDLSYEDDLADDFLHTYTVTALYAEGESGHSNAVSLTSGLEQARFDTRVYSVGKTIVAESDAEQVMRVFSVDGRAIFAGNITGGICKVTLNSPGIYIVAVGNSVAKLTIK